MVSSNFKKNKKGKSSKTLILHAAGVFILALFVVLIIADVHLYQTRKEFLAQVQNLNTQIQDTKQQNTLLQQNISEASNDQYIETVAREELDLQKPGETAVSFVMPKSQDQTPPPPEPNALARWTGWIGGSFEWVKNNF